MTKGSQKKPTIKSSTIAKYKRVVDEWLNNGENGTKAYQKFYPKAKERTAVNNFKKILTNADIQFHVKQQKKIKAEAVKKEYDFTFEQQVQDQLKKKKVFEMLLELGTKETLTPVEKERFERLKSFMNLNGINKADDILNKMLGFDAAIKIAETDVEGKDKVDYSSLTSEELIARVKAAKLLKEAL